MDSFRPEQETCPCCGFKGDCHIHGYYSRYILDFRKGKPHCVRIRVMRVMCSCGHTHAILPDFIVPYRQLSLKYLIQILFAFCARRQTIENICQRYQVDASFLYRLKALYEDHRQLWLGRMEAASQPSPGFLRRLCFHPDLSTFLHAFYRRTTFSFLQCHKNPTANSDGCELRR